MRRYNNIIIAMLVLLAVSVFSGLLAVAGTTDKTIGGTSGYPKRAGGKTYLMARTLNFSTSKDTGTINEIYQMFNLPAGTFVLKVGYSIEENKSGTYGEAGTCTIDIGDGSDADGYIDGANVETGQVYTAVSQWAVGSVQYSMASNVTVNTYSLSVATGQPTVVTTTFTNHVVDVANGGGITNYVTSILTNVYTLVASVANNVLTVPVTTNVTVSSVAYYPVTTAPKPYANGKLYTSTDTVDMTLKNNATLLKITVRALVIPIAGL